jgi:hypothetical protein
MNPTYRELRHVWLCFWALVEWCWERVNGRTNVEVCVPVEASFVSVSPGSKDDFSG